MVDRMPVEEGWVYGQKPKEPEARSGCFLGKVSVILTAWRLQAPPDLESLFEAAGVSPALFAVLAILAL